MADNVIGILFGVAGGSDINGKTGALIKSQLESLANKIKLKVNVDRTYFSKQLDQLKKELDAKLGSIKINVARNGQSVKASNSPAAASTSKNSKELSVYNDLKTQLEQVYALHQKLGAVRNQATERFLVLQTQANALMREYEASLQGAQSSGKISEKDLESLKSRQAYLEKVRQAQEALNAAIDKDKMAGSMLTSFEGLQAKVQGLNERYMDLIAHNKEAAAAMKNLTAMANQPYAGQDRVVNGVKVAADMSQANAQVKNLSVSLKQTSALMSKLSVQSDTFGTKFRKAFSSKILNSLSYVLIGLSLRAFKQVYDNVVKIDYAMTQLKIVTRQSATAFENFASRVTTSAKKIGAGVAELIESTTVYARLGYSLNEAAVFAEKTTSYSKVADLSVNEATTNITAIIKAFNISAKEVESVLDQLIYVGNNYAISSAEIGEAMNNAASSLAANGNTLQEAIGIVTAANVTLQNVSKSSTAVRTIAARISRSKAELEDLGEDIGNVLTTSKLDATMREFGVAIVDANGELRSTFDILGDLSKVWDDLGSTERAAVADMLAGTRQQNAFYSIMQNWKDAESVVANKASAIGSLQKGEETRLNSIDGKLDQLTASWESFSTNFLNSELVKSLVSILSGIVSVLDVVISQFDMFSTIVAIIGGVLLSKFIAKLTGSTTSLKGFGKAIKKFFTDTQGGFKKFLTSGGLATVIATVLTLVLSFISKIKTQGANIATVILSLVSIIAAGIIIALKLIKGTLDSIPIFAVIEIALAALMALIAGIKNLINASKKAKEDAVEAAKEAKDAWQSTLDSIKELEEEIDNLKNRISTLSELSKNGSITLVEEQELVKLKERIKLLEVQRQNLETLAKAQEEAAKKASANAINKILNERVNRTRAENYVVTVLGNWQSATDKEKAFVSDFYNALLEQGEVLTYYTGENLKDWQKQVNDAYDQVWKYTDRIQLTTSDNGFSTVWDSLLSRDKYTNAIDVLEQLAKKGEVTSDKLSNLYYSHDNVRQLLDYLRELGVFSWNDEQSVAALVNQIQLLASGTRKATVSSKSFIDILNAVQGKFDSLNDALDSLTSNGIVAADTITQLLDKYPELEKYLKLTNQGYVLNDKYTGWSNREILDDFVSDYLQSYVDDLAACEEGTENYAKAQENLNNAIAVCATLLRSQAIEEEKQNLEKKKDDLDEQLDKYKDLIDIRKDLLQTYKEELDYRKKLAEKQTNVANLKTQLQLAKMDNSATGKARAKELENELKKAQEELDDFTLEHAIDVLCDEIDSGYEEYEKFIKSEVDRIEAAINEIAKNLNVSVDTPEPSPKEESKPETSKPTMGSNGNIYNGYKAPQWMYDYGISLTLDEAKQLRKDLARRNPNGHYDAKLNDLNEYIKWIQDHTYHTGGFVGDVIRTRNNEEFAKLLQGEYVVTPQQMSVFMTKTLPGLQGAAGGVISYNAPLISIKCDSITEESMPKLKGIVNEAVTKLKNELDSSFRRTGFKKTVNKFSI